MQMAGSLLGLEDFKVLPGRGECRHVPALPHTLLLCSTVLSLSCLVFFSILMPFLTLVSCPGCLPDPTLPKFTCNPFPCPYRRQFSELL